MSGKVRVTIDRIYVKTTSDKLWGLPEWKINARINGKQFGDPKAIFYARSRSEIVLGGDLWTKVVDGPTSPKTNIDITIQIEDEIDGEVGIATLLSPWPSILSAPMPECQNFLVHLDVALIGYDSAGPHGGNEVFACKAGVAGPECFTISGAPVKTRFEIYPVRPQPPYNPARFPERLKFGGKHLGVPLNKSNKGTIVTDKSPINVLPNPPVIIVMPEGLARVDKTRPARIECTYCQPPGLNIKPEDKRLTWSSISLDGKGKVGFEGKTQGTRVLVYGVSEGEVKLELRFEGSVVASYRALVRERKSIPCRVTILDGGIGARPLSDGDAIYRHIEAANRYLRPAGVALELDIDNSTKNGAALLRQGIFKITGVPPGDTANVPTSGFPMSWRYNYRSKVLNIIYIHSFVSPPGWTVGGQCPIYPKTKAIASTNPMYAGWFQTTDIGTPSSSWIKPSGVWPDGGAYSVTIRLIPERKDPSAPDLMATVGIPNLFTGSQTSAIALRKYGYTIAHEVGHALSLAHRGDGGQDGQSHPKKQNLMYQHTMPLLSQSIDIVQALAIHESPILR